MLIFQTVSLPSTKYLYRPQHLFMDRQEKNTSHKHNTTNSNIPISAIVAYIFDPFFQHEKLVEIILMS